MFKLHKLGEELFGAGWQSKLARHIGVDSRQVRRWMAGDSPIPRLLLLYLGLLTAIPWRTRTKWLRKSAAQLCEKETTP